MMKTITITLSILMAIVWLVACGPTDAGPASLPEEVEKMLAEEGGAFVILTLADTLDASLQAQLDEAGIVLFDPLGANQYQAYLPQTAVPTLAALQANQNITSVAAIDPATKIKGSFTDPAKSYAIIVHFYKAPAEAETDVLANQMTVRDTAVGVMNFAEGEATANQIEAIANLSFVKGIEEAVVSTGGEGN
jgi:hypothetical protein